MQIAKRRNAHIEKNPDAKVISLGIGDTTEPITPTVSKAMADAALGMGTREGYSGCVVMRAGACTVHEPLVQPCMSYCESGIAFSMPISISVRNNTKADLAVCTMHMSTSTSLNAWARS